MVMIKIAWDLDECSFMFVALLKKKKRYHQSALINASSTKKYKNVGSTLKSRKKTLGHYMFYWGIMGRGLLDSVGLIIKIQDVAVQIMSSIG